MKKLILLLIFAMVFTVSCTLSKDQITDLSSIILTAIAGLIGVFTGTKLNKK